MKTVHDYDVYLHSKQQIKVFLKRSINDLQTLLEEYNTYEGYLDEEIFESIDNIVTNRLHNALSIFKQQKTGVANEI